MESNDAHAQRRSAASVSLRLAAVVYAFCLICAGLVLVLGGARLISLGGSFYYLLGGLAAAASGVAVLIRRWNLGATIYLLLMMDTSLWALGEVGLNGWALAPRVLSPAVLGLPFLLAAFIGGARKDRLWAFVATLAGVVLIAAVALSSRYQPVSPRPAEGTAVAAAGAQDGDWPHFGNTQAGTHFSPLTDINRDNAGKLKVAWTTPIGPLPVKPASRMQTSPLKINGKLYVCSPFNDVIALDPDTGKVVWRFDAKTSTAGLLQAKCRGVAYYAIPAAAGPCAKRVYVATEGDARLIGLDADTGLLCPTFGAGGVVDLLKGQRQRSQGYYSPTSAPTVVRGKLVIGGGVGDGQYVGEPSGVIRAYDAVTGKLAWAWDLGKPGYHGEPPPGETYTLGTPDSWGPMSADEALGLVYVATGESTPSYWGKHRTAESNQYASSVIALDAETGEPRWSFQTTHYDLWDYDVGSQPVLFDLRTAGGVVPALLQPTKRGELFVLDRRTGKPLFPVEEKPAPQAGSVERPSPTQPWSVAFPHLMGPLLTERSMWGLTAVDQLWCRIRFRKARYEGSMTPPGLTYSIADPGYIGGSDWGSASIDTTRQLAFLPSNRMVNYIRLVPQSDPAARRLRVAPDVDRGGFVKQEGTPYAADIAPFFSPLKVPCQAPPHGLINAVDLRTGKMVWSRPLGSARDLGPMGHASHLPFTIGTPNFGGALSTAGGLVFVGASHDHAFRVFDSETGRLLFTADLSGDGGASPVSYRSDRNGRQFVVIASDGPVHGGVRYGAVTAFVLPGK